MSEYRTVPIFRQTDIPTFEHYCRNIGPYLYSDSPMFRHVGTSVHFCRNSGTYLSEYRHVGIAGRRNSGTAPNIYHITMPYHHHNPRNITNFLPEYHHITSFFGEFHVSPESPISNIYLLLRRRVS